MFFMVDNVTHILHQFNRRKFGGGGGSAAAKAPSAPPLQQQQPKATSTNPFASTTLPPPAAANPTNPFGNVTLTSNATSASTKPAFSFASSSSGSAPKPAKSTFSFSSTTNNNTTTNNNSAISTLFSTPKPRQQSSSSNDLNAQTLDLNTILLQTIQDHWNGGHKFSDYSGFLKQYQDHAQTLIDLEEANEENEAAVPSATVDSTSTSNGNTQSTSSFSFGGATSTTSGSTAKPFSMSVPVQQPPAAASKPPFSFTAQPSSSAAPAPAALSFSFGASSATSTAKSASLFSAPTPANTTTQATTPAATSNDDDPTSNPDDGKIEKIESEENTEEDTLYEVRAKHMKIENGGWKKYGTGVLRVYKHKQTSKHRVVIRNSIGKVQFNVAISKGMKFDKVTKDGKKGKSTFVSFGAVEDVAKGMESFMIQVKPESVDALHDALSKTV